MIPRSKESIRLVQVISFDYENQRPTIHVITITSNFIEGIVQCGKHRGETKNFEKIEILNTVELFAVVALKDLYKKLGTLA